MKRDLDLCRQLLFDLEAHSSECAINTLRAGEPDDRIRYHLRLLCDAGLVKETNRTNGSFTSLRLTSAGAELIELSRSNARWRDAKALVLDRTGGQSLAAIRSVLTKWAVDASTHGYAYEPRPTYTPYYRREEAIRRYDGHRYERDLLEVDDQLRLVRTGPDYRERWYDADYYLTGSTNEQQTVDSNAGVQLPIYLV